MSVNFPSTSLTIGQVYTNGSRSWTWTGVYWKATSTTIGFTGSKGESSYTYSDTPPVNPVVGDRWYNTVDAVEVVWTSDGTNLNWIDISAGGFLGQTGYTGSSGGSVYQGYTGSASTAVGYTGSTGAGYTGSRGIGYTGSIGSGYTGSASFVQGPSGYTGSASTAVGYTGSQGTTGKAIAMAIVFGG